MNLFAGLGALNGFLAVALAAFGTHALGETVSAEQVASLQKASHYQMVHALALLAAGWMHESRPGKVTRLAGLAFFFGIFFFCGAVYSIGFTGSRALAPAAPLGGTLFMIGWLALAVSAFGKKPKGS